MALWADAGGAEGHRRVDLDVQELSAAQVPVALLFAGVDRGQVDSALTCECSGSEPVTMVPDNAANRPAPCPPSGAGR